MEIWSGKGFEEKFEILIGEGALRLAERTPGAFFKGYGETALYLVVQRTQTWPATTLFLRS